VPSLYNNRAVDGSWCQLNWRLSSLGLEETWLEIQNEIIKPRTLEKNKMRIETMEPEKTDVSDIRHHKIVSQAEWLVARKDLLKREKELTRKA
jgi:Bacterial protein of unknown function (DUF899)